MKSRSVEPAMWVARALVLCLLGAAGCQSPPNASDLPQRIETITGVGQGICFEHDGGPLDVAADLPNLLTLQDATRAAVWSDPTLQAAIARVRIAQADARQQRLLPNPILSLVIRFPDSGGKPVIEAGLTAELISVLAKPRQMSAADSRLRSACADALKVAIDVVAAVQESYFAVQTSDAQRVVLDEQRKLIVRLIELANARVKAGESNSLDVVTLEAQQAEIDAEIIVASARRADERLSLARLIGRPSLTADRDVSPWELPKEPSGTESEWVAMALSLRPEVQALSWELAALGDDVAIAGLFSFDGAEVGVAAERDGDWTVGPAVATPIPLFDWGQARRAKAEAQLIEARHQLTQSRRQVVEDVRRAWKSFEYSKRALDSARTRLIPLQERRREQAEAAYKNGLVDITVVFLAEHDLQESRSKLIEFQKSNSLALVRLQRAVGGPGVNVISRMPTSRPSTATNP